jgi:Protein of unknown function (DUF3617)
LLLCFFNQEIAMKHIAFSVLLSSASALAAAQTTAPNAGPSAGMWELALTMEGGPGSGTRIGKSCLAAEPLAAAPEQTLFEAAGKAASSGGGGGGRGRTLPKCDFGTVQRNGEKSAWQAQCEGPSGKIQGAGSGTLSAETANLQQAFTVKSLMGTMNVQQTLVARRLGNCG